MNNLEQNKNDATPLRREAKGGSRMKRRVRIVLSMLLASYLGIGVYFWLIQDREIFKPLSLEESKATREDFQTPADFGLAYDELTFPANQSEIPIHGFWLPASDEAPVAIYLHGQEVTRHNNLHHAKCLNELGCNVLVIDYRGYGETCGKMTPTEKSVCDDAQAAWEYVTETKNIAPERILIYGHSLGGAIAIDLATEHPEAGGLVVESTFTSIKDIARFKNPLTHVLPLSFLLRHPFDSAEKIREEKLPPVLFVHGTADSKVPCSMCEHLHESARGPSKDMVLIKGGEHADRKQGQADYQTKVAAFLNKCFGPCPKGMFHGGTVGRAFAPTKRPE